MNPVLTNAQLLQLKTLIASTPAMAAKPANDDGDFDIATLLNADGAPASVVWKTSVNLMEVTGRPGFDWTRVDNLSVGKARIWEWMFLTNFANPSFASVRAGVEAAFATAADDPCRQAFYDAGVRNASVVEKLYAPNGVAPNAHGVGPVGMPSVGPITPAEVHAARNAT